MGFYWAHNFFPLHSLSFLSLNYTPSPLFLSSLLLQLLTSSNFWGTEVRNVNLRSKALPFTGWDHLSQSLEAFLTISNHALEGGGRPEGALWVSGSCNKPTAAAAVHAHGRFWSQLYKFLKLNENGPKPHKGMEKMSSPLWKCSYRRWSASCPGYFGCCGSFPGGFLSLAQQQLLLLSKLPPYTNWENKSYHTEVYFSSSHLLQQFKDH